MQHCLGVEARAEVALAAEGGHAESGVVQEVRAGEGRVGNELQIAAGRNIFQPAQVAELLVEAIHLLRHVRPEGVLIVDGDQPEQRETPGLSGGAREAQAAERDGHHGRISLRSQAACGIPQRIEAEIVALALGLDPVRLHAVRIHEELIAALAIVIGVQDHAHYVVAEDVLAFRHAGARLVSGRFAYEHRIKVHVVVTDPRRSLAADGHAIAGLPLAEIVDALHVVARPALQKLL